MKTKLFRRDFTLVVIGQIISLFGKDSIKDYGYYDYHRCPMCAAGQKLDALVNAYGYTSL